MIVMGQKVGFQTGYRLQLSTQLFSDHGYMTIAMHYHSVFMGGFRGVGAQGVATPKNGQSHSIKCSTRPTEVLSQVNALAKSLVVV